jgi:hypothetical protein
MEQLEPIMDPPPKMARRSKQQLLSDYEIHIKFLSSGCLINVGCKSIAFSSSDEAIAELNRYFENPSKVDDEWQIKFNQ